MSISPTDYYANADVRARISDFLGGHEDGCSSVYLAKPGPGSAIGQEPCSPRELPSFFDGGWEIARSLWDRTSLLADLDVEYVNFDHPAEVYLDPERAFALQQPVVATIERFLSSFGIKPLHFLSGRGHHFVWRIAQQSPVFDRLAALGRGPPSLWRRYSADNSSLPSPKLARAFAGLALLMEFVAERAKWTAAPSAQVPVELTAIEVGPSAHGREMISLDISEYGDPLESRMVRVPFSIYLKPYQQHGAIADDVLKRLSPLVGIPAETISLPEALRCMRDPDTAAALARVGVTRIPEFNAETESLLDQYERSEMKKFHDLFYAVEAEPRERWRDTYDRTPLEILPACVRLVLEQPNDLLLRPGCIRRLVRTLLALDWHPRHIAGLITSKYERDFQWTQFTGYDPATHAEFYVRVFAGQFATGGDDLVDFNCTSAREQGLCFFMNCNDNLLRFKASALTRRSHDQLACRPFNGLLLPTEYS